MTMLTYLDDFPNFDKKVESINDCLKQKENWKRIEIAYFRIVLC